MKILLLISESWNDSLHPNNNLTNWFEGMKDVEIATIYANPALPDNKCCTEYFQLTEKSMVKSLVGKKRAGRAFSVTQTQTHQRQEIKEENIGLYRFFKSISNDFIRLIRDVIWKTGRIDKNGLKSFINDFNPDIIFTQRMGSVKMCRIERLVKSIADVPIVAYTGDDEYSLNHRSFSPIFWTRRFWVRHELKKNIPMYNLFYSMSEQQMREFHNEFGSNMNFLVKTGEFNKDNIHTRLHNPIVITYAGKLYCNRWKTLSMLSQCISQINAQGGNFILNIYTRDKITKKQRKLLDNGTCSFIKGGVNSEELKGIYKKSDILLHVESFDKANSLAVKYSFSTKIMECLSSGCAVMAIGKANQAGCEYLRKKDAALVASSETELFNILLKIAVNPRIILKYALKAYECGITFHQKSQIQEKIKTDFQQVIAQYQQTC